MLIEESANANSVDTEIQRVGQIQRALLPDPLPKIPGLDIAASYETFSEAGGDIYDFIPLGRERSVYEPWAMFIGDASGHGASAAVVIAIVQALLHAHPPGITSPASLLGHLNKHLCRRPIENSFVTAFLAVYEPATRRLTYALAGHPRPLLKRNRAQAVKTLDSGGGYPIGIDVDQVFPEANVNLEHGDVLLLYTDGIQEARDKFGMMFGTEGIEAAIRGCRGVPDEFVASLRQAVTAHENGRRANDDQTLVAIRAI